MADFLSAGDILGAPPVNNAGPRPLSLEDILGAPQPIQPNQSDLRFSLQSGLSKNSDKAARDRGTAQDLGLPTAAAQDNQRAHDAAAVSKAIGDTSKAPLTQQWLSNLNNAAVTSPLDITGLVTNEAVGKKLGSPPNSVLFKEALTKTELDFFSAAQAGAELINRGFPGTFDTGPVDAKVSELSKKLNASLSRFQRQELSKVKSLSDLFEFGRQQSVNVAALLGEVAAVTGVAATAGLDAAAAGLAGTAIIFGFGEQANVQEKAKAIDPNFKASPTSVGTGVAAAAIDVALGGAIGKTILKAFGPALADKAVAEIATLAASKTSSSVAELTKAISGVLAKVATSAAEGAVAGATRAAVVNAGVASATGTKLNPDKLAEDVVNGALEFALLSGTLRAAGETGARAAKIVKTVKSVRAFKKATEDLRNARNVKQATDTMHRGKTDSPLAKRSPEAYNASVKAHFDAAGVKEVIVPTELIAAIARRNPRDFSGTITRIMGSNDALTKAMREGKDAVVPVENFIKEILGTPAYPLLDNQIKFDPTKQSVDEATKSVIPDQKTVEGLKKELDGYAVAKDTKDAVASVIEKMTPENFREVFDAAPPDVQVTLSALINAHEDRQSAVRDTVTKGRVSQLDAEIAVQDTVISTAQDAIDARVKDNASLPKSQQKATKALETKIAKAVDRRDVLIAEQNDLTLPSQRAGKSSQFDQNIVPAEPAPTKDALLTGKDIKVKGGVLQLLDSRITKEAVRATRNAFRAGLKSGEALTVAKNKLIKALGTPALSEAQKKNITKSISAIRTEAQFKKKLPVLQSKVSVMMEANRREQIVSIIKKLLKKTAAKNVGGKPVGKFDADTQELLDEARAVISLSKAEAAVAFEEALNDISPEPKDAFLTQLKALAADSPDVNNSDAEKIMLALAEFKAQGRAANISKLVAKRRKVNFTVSLAREGVTEGKPAAEITTTGFMNRLKLKGQDAATSIGSWWNGWDEVLDINFNTKGFDAANLISDLRLTNEVQDTKAQMMKWEEDAALLEQNIFGLDGYQKVHEHQIEDSKRTDFGVFENLAGKEIRLEYSKAEIRKLWMEFQDPLLAEVITSEKGMAYDETMLGVLFKTLTTMDKDFARGQLQLYRGMYPIVNKVYRRVYGVNLPFNEFYSPIQRDLTKSNQKSGSNEVGSDQILVEERKHRRSLASQVKNRTVNLHPLLRRSDVGAMRRYMHDMSWFVHTTEKVSFIKAVFKDQMLLGDIQSKHGTTMPRLINAFLEDFGSGYPARGVVGEKLIGASNRLFASSILAFKGTIAAKQLVSYFAMMENIPAADFLKYSGDFLRSPKANAKILFEGSASLRARGSSLDFELAKIGALEEPLIRFKKENIWERSKFFLIKAGDRAPIYLGGWAVYKHALAQGKSKKEAIQAFDRATNSTQQSTDIDKLSDMQRMGAVGRAITMFMTARFSLLRGEFRAFRQFKRGKITWKEFGKRIAIYHFVMPMLIQFIASGFTWEKDRQTIAAVLGQFNSVVIFGDIMSFMAEKMLADNPRSFRGDALPIKDVFIGLAQGASDAIDSVNSDQVMEAALKILGELGKLRGIPVDQASNAVSGLGDIKKGKTEIGMKKIFGFSDKTATKSSK